MSQLKTERNVVELNLYVYIYIYFPACFFQGSRQFIRNVWTKRVGFSRHSLEFSCLKERITIYLSQKQKRIKNSWFDPRIS